MGTPRGSERRASPWKPMENVSHSAAHPRDPADARPVRTRAPATAPGAGRWPPAAAARRIRMPAALVAGGALRVPAGWASGPPFPRPAAAGVAAVAESSGGSGPAHDDRHLDAAWA